MAQARLVIELTVALDGERIGVISKNLNDVTIEAGRGLSTNLDLSSLISDQPGDYRMQLMVNGRLVAHGR